jgi:hypothetical protein
LAVQEEAILENIIVKIFSYRKQRSTFNVELVEFAAMLHRFKVVALVTVAAPNQ